MTLHRFTAVVRVPTNTGTNQLVRTQVQAEDVFRAVLLLQQQYGKGSVIGMPQKAA